LIANSPDLGIDLLLTHKMSASQSPIVRVPSRCTPETARATVAFEVVGYSLHKGLGRGKCLRSVAFSIGGYEWYIRYYPDGNTSETSEDYVSVCLSLLTKNVEVRANYSFNLVKTVTGPSVGVCSSKQSKLFDDSHFWGRKFRKKTVEQESV
jgi:speckle-type POZ protein